MGLAGHFRSTVLAAFSFQALAANHGVVVRGVNIQKVQHRHGVAVMILGILMAQIIGNFVGFNLLHNEVD